MSKRKRIHISELRSLLEQLQNGQLEFDFAGITSNGADCIYFVPDGDWFAIEFEVMTTQQQPWLEKLQAFAQQNNFGMSMTTYNNKPDYPSTEPAPVLRIEPKSNIDQAALIGQTILTQFFGNNAETVYEIIP